MVVLKAESGRSRWAPGQAPPMLADRHRADGEEHREQRREEHQLGRQPDDGPHADQIGTVRPGVRCCLDRGSCHGRHYCAPTSRVTQDPPHTVPERVRDAPDPVTFRSMSTAPESPMKVLVYSDDADTRAQIRLAIGRRPAAGLPKVEFIERATQPAVVERLDEGDIDVAHRRRRGAARGRPRRVPPGQGRGLRLPARPRRHRPPRRRLAGDVVAGRRGREHAARPDGRRQRGGRADAQRIETRLPVLDPRPGPATGFRGPSCQTADAVGDMSSTHRDARTTWPALLNALLSGESLSARGDLLGHEQHHGRRGHRRADRGLRRRAARQGRDGRGGDRPRRGHDGQRHPGGRAGPDRRPRRDRRGPGAHGQRLHDGRRGLRGGGRPGRQARQPGGVVVVRRRGPAGAPRRRHRPEPRGDRAGRRAGRHHVLLRAALPPGAQARGAHPRRARHADGVQLPRPADEPGAPHLPGRRGVPPADGGGGRGRVRRSGAAPRWCSAATTASTS